MTDFSTIAIHGAEGPDPTTGAQNPPIYQTATFQLPDTTAQVKLGSGGADGYFYTREGNPTTAVLEQKVAMLEGAEAAIASASGMGVISAAVLSLLNPGDHLLCSDAIYPVSQDFISSELPRLGIEVSTVDITDLVAIDAALQPNTRMVLTEFLSNPELKVADLEQLAALTHQAGAKLVVDNTFATPYLIRPLAYGVDIVLHSATKYLSGHGDAVGGIAAGSDELIRPMRRIVARYGSPISPFNAWLIIRGIKTLSLRMDRHCENAMKLAEHLSAHPGVASVMYPGLPGHPGLELADRLMHGRFGGMLAMTLTGGERACQRFGGALQMCYRAVSLGDTSTLVLPWTSRNLVRVSVGLEGIEDIIADIDQALAAE